MRVWSSYRHRPASLRFNEAEARAPRMQIAAYDEMLATLGFNEAEASICFPWPQGRIEITDGGTGPARDLFEPLLNAFQNGHDCTRARL